MAAYLPSSFNQRFSRIFCLLVFCFIHLASIWSQQNELSFRNYTIQDGLPDNHVGVMFQDSRRFLWMGTNEGLSRFDGNNFKNYFHNTGDKNSLPSNIIMSIIEYKKGHLLIATNVGCRCYDMVADSLYLPNEAFLRQKQIISMIPDSLGNLWMIAEGNLLVMTDEVLRLKKKWDINFQLYGALEKVHMLDDGRLLIVTRDGQYYLDTENNTLLPLQQQFKQKLPATFPNSIYDAENNRLIAWSWDEGIFIIHLSTNRVESFPSKVCDGCFWGNPRCALLDKNGNIWIGTDRGIYYYDERQKIFRATMHDDRNLSSLIYNNVRLLFKDDEDNIWIGTDRGVSKLSRQMRQISFYRQPWEINGNRQDLYDIEKGSDDNLYIAAFENGFFQYNTRTGKIKNYRQFPGWSVNVVGNLVYMTGHSKGKILIYDIKKQKLESNDEMKPFFLPLSNLITFAYRDSYGDRWWSINEGGGLIHQPNGSTSYDVYRPGSASGTYPFRYANKITEDEQGNLWFGLNKKYEVACWLREEKKFMTLDPKAILKGKNVGGGVQALLADKKGSIWIGTAGTGLLRYNINTNQAAAYNIEEGLPSNNVSSLVMDKTGRLWAGTSKGLSCFIVNENRFINFSKSDGLPENHFNEGPGYFDSSANRIYMAAYDFLISFCPDSLLNITSKKLPVYLEGVWVNGEKKYPQKNQVKLRHDENSLRFDFTGIDLLSNQSPVFAYWLEGTDNSWHYTNTARSVTYHSLPQGKYTFKLRIQKAGMKDWNEITIPLQIIIRPAWWQTWWFYSAVALLIFTVAYISIREIIYHKLEKQRLTLGKQKAIETERVRISSELHDDLGGGLSTIRLMSELIQHGDKKDESKQQLEKISSNSKELVQKMNEIVWALNIKNDTLAGLLAYIRQYAVHFLDDNMLECNLSIPEQIPDIAVTGSRRRDIFLLVKESLNNTVKHARATKVDIIFIIDDLLQIKIHDDGVGFDATRLTTTSNGLRNMGKRVDALTGTMTIKNHQGTTIIFDIPLKNLSHESVQ